MEDRYRLLMACDGSTDVVWETLSDEQRFYYEYWEKNHVIRRAKPGERLLGHQKYRFYRARFKQAEQTAVDAIRRCADRGFGVSASMVVCKESVGCIRESVNLLASLGVRHIKVGAANPQGEWLNEPDHFLSRPELYEAFLEYIPHYFEDGKPGSIGLEGFFSYDLPDRGPYSLHEKNIEEKYFPKAQMCGHVRKEMYVSPQGNVLPCMSMVGGPIEQQFPNMLEKPLEEILDTDSLYMDIVSYTVEDYMKHNPECRECRYKEQCCGGCRAVAVRGHPTDYLAKDLDVCEYFKGGWKHRKDQLFSGGKLL